MVSELRPEQWKQEEGSIPGRRINRYKGLETVGLVLSRIERSLVWLEPFWHLDLL